MTQAAIALILLVRINNNELQLLSGHFAKIQQFQQRSPQTSTDAL